ncbi:thiol:disulfide interchange protein tlpA [Lentibacillus populi]|uniref:Thiol:disulfide interchange protein tlpA n=1 Tax=Lentibacillus populi TaxID=1827502 RepID=A0A9W5X520_9BACI|nr:MULTISPECIES: redoxin domain-containing protein [Bacillaceae]MBT2215432.1 redoxin domain-containing protein [Virgibacillus dakarensis]GGB40159.1 thiol:disulfide interchange protein tlpA [Lentibacillus populi]
MKKAIIIIVLIGMIGWAVYDFVNQSDDTSIQDENEEIKQEASSDSDKDNKAAADKKSETTNAVTVGLEVGNAAPDFQLKTLSGKNVKLSDYRGQRVMVNFWATWCPPCRAEMPDLEKFHQNKDVVILAVNLTQTEQGMQEVQNFVDEFNLTFPILLDENIEVANTYAIRPIPTSFMVDSNGIIQYKAFGALHYEMMVEEFEKMK